MEITQGLRFGPFELDVRAGELRRGRIRIRLQQQSFQILLMLLDAPGQVVLRSDIRQQLWPNDTVVDFDQSINAAIRRLRGALGESAEEPRFIETLSKRGYRFLGKVERIGEPPPDPHGNAVSHGRPFEQLGERGLGVIGRAEDRKPSRPVAVKSRTDGALPQPPGQNHPHVPRNPGILMELVEGETLAARLARGPLRLPDALGIAIRIAGALAESHAAGTASGALRPANILLTKNGAKVLDFAPAVALASTVPDSPDEAIPDALYYLSPEQGRGKSPDPRSDIFSFGCVLYESLVGQRAFEGSSQAGVIAAINERPAPLIADVAPPALDRLLRRCLEKNPADRWQSALGLKAELERIAGALPLAKQVPSPSRIKWARIAAAVLAITTGVAIWAPWRPSPKPSQPVRLQILLPPGVNPGVSFSLSPDGTRLAFTASRADGVLRLWVRTMDTLESRELAGTEGLTDAPLFWSPDSRFIAFDGNGKLRKIDAAGGPPQTICSTPGAVVGGSWNRKGVILFGIYNTAGIQRVSAAGGAPSPATAMNAARKDTSHVFPLLLPDGRHFLYLVNSAIPENRGIYVGSLDSKPDRQAPTRLLATAFGPGFVSLGGEKGQLLFQRDGALLAQPFDLRRLETGGEASPVAGQLGPGSLNFGDFAASENGTLVYRAAAGGNGEMSQTPFTIVQNWMSVVPR